jgi:hypothetical protein
MRTQSADTALLIMFGVTGLVLAALALYQLLVGRKIVEFGDVERSRLDSLTNDLRDRFGEPMVHRTANRIIVKSNIEVNPWFGYSTSTRRVVIDWNEAPASGHRNPSEHPYRRSPLQTGNVVVTARAYPFRLPDRNGEQPVTQDELIRLLRKIIEPEAGEAGRSA